MGTYSLKYGPGLVSLELPSRLVGAHEFLGRGEKPRSVRTLGHAIAELRGHGLEEAVRGRRVAVLLSDGTRPGSREHTLPEILPLLGSAASVRVFLATGTHAPDLPENLRAAAETRRFIAASGFQVDLRVHDARGGEFVDLGTTSRGTRLSFDAASQDREVFLTVSDMKNHYFAGYSNPVKHVMPGIASFETARGNHSLALDPRARSAVHPWHPDPERRDNPVAEDMVEGWTRFQAGRPSFALVTITRGDEILWAGGGRTEEVAGRGMLEVDRLAGIVVRPARYLIVSAGGEPLDESLYSSQRALELTREALLPGGEVLFLARCGNGIGPPSARENFFERLARPLDQVLGALDEEYVMYSHKPLRFAHYLNRAGTVHLMSELPASDVERIHMRPVGDPREVVVGWVRQAGADDRVVLIDDGSSVAVRSAAGADQQPMP